MAATVEDMAQVHIIYPRSDAEAAYGKPCLLTDTMIAQVLDVLKTAQAASEIGQEACDTLWAKFLDLWGQER
jgi:hypothetical protein